MTEELTLRLPAELVYRVRQAAERWHQPPDQVVAGVLDVSLPPLRSEAKASLALLIEALEGKPEEELRGKVRTRLSDSEQARLSELLARNREGTLTEKEDEQLEALLDRVEKIASERAIAAWLLAQKATHSP